jgi:hypothetical protein
MPLSFNGVSPACPQLAKTFEDTDTMRMLDAEIPALSRFLALLVFQRRIVSGLIAGAIKG